MAIQQAKKFLIDLQAQTLIQVRRQLQEQLLVLPAIKKGINKS
jgi:hypothetical protein